jgi:RNA polymerase sigma-70 factor, ECF subfamily
VDHASDKRGGSVVLTCIDDKPIASTFNIDLLALDEALNRLAVMDPQRARIVELRYFGGLTIEETAGALGISPATVKRDWAWIKAWLFQQLGPA